MACNQRNLVGVSGGGGDSGVGVSGGGGSGSGVGGEQGLYVVVK